MFRKIFELIEKEVTPFQATLRDIEITPNKLIVNTGWKEIKDFRNEKWNVDSTIYLRKEEKGVKEVLRNEIEILNVLKEKLMKVEITLEEEISYSKKRNEAYDFMKEKIESRYEKWQEDKKYDEEGKLLINPAYIFQIEGKK